MGNMHGEPVASLTRRCFLTRIGSIGGSAAVLTALESWNMGLASAQNAPPRLEGSANGRSVVIVGAGLAGLGAAYEAAMEKVEGMKPTKLRQPERLRLENELETIAIECLEMESQFYHPPFGTTEEQHRAIACMSICGRITLSAPEGKLDAERLHELPPLPRDEDGPVFAEP